MSITKRIEGDILKKVIHYDTQFFPDDRKDFIKNWITQDETIGVAFINNVASDNNPTEIKGKGVPLIVLSELGVQ